MIEEVHTGAEGSYRAIEPHKKKIYINKRVCGAKIVSASHATVFSRAGRCQPNINIIKYSEY